MSDERDCDCMNTYFHTCRTDDALAAGRHPKWVRVDPGTVIPAGQPYRVENEDGRHREYPGKASPDVYYDELEEMTGLFLDSSWKPPLVLPTAAGSVIEARSDRGHGPFLWMRTEFPGDWVSDAGERHKSEALNPLRVLFDAGAGR